MRTNKKRRYPDLSPLIALLNRFFKKKDGKALTAVLSRYVRGEDISIIPEKRYRKLKRILFVLFIVLLVSASTVYYFVSRGYSYEYFLADKYGAVTFSVRIPSGIMQPEDLSFSAVVMRDDSGDKETVGIPLQFHRAAEVDQGFVDFRTPRMYLASDSYRMKVEFENQIYVKSFFLAPRILQRSSPPTAEEKRVVATIQSIAPQPVRLLYTVTNRNTGFDISPGTSLFLDIDGEWIPWDPFFAQYLRSGGSYRLMFAAERFYPVVYELRLSPFQSEVNLQVDLIPHPGYVRVTVDTRGITFRLNNSEYYLSGGRERQLRRLESPGVAPLIIELSPGTYILTAVASEFVTRDTSLTVSSDSIMEVRVKFNEQSNAIEIETAQ